MFESTFSGANIPFWPGYLPSIQMAAFVFLSLSPILLLSFSRYRFRQMNNLCSTFNCCGSTPTISLHPFSCACVQFGRNFSVLTLIQFAIWQFAWKYISVCVCVDFVNAQSKCIDPTRPRNFKFSFISFALSFHIHTWNIFCFLFTLFACPIRIDLLLM